MKPAGLGVFLSTMAAFLFCAAVAAAPSSDPPQSAPANPDYEKAAALIEAEKFAEALPLLRKAEAAEPDSADVHNYLGYALRKLKNYDAALKHYKIALRLAPKHRGANEYLGELYLVLGDLEKAEERLAVLDKACLFGCEEYTELKDAIAAYKARLGQ
ncbi:MAG: tetratricopeptide repeat protein [Defluviicoccus sp.]|nr:tetratricopeptide repeat protein [Defluviicoccus sp.]